MPTYQYRCTECGDREVWQSIHEPALKVCACGNRLTKVLCPPRLSVHATPNKGQEARRLGAKDSAWDRDMSAYRRLRRNGTQPPRIDGSANLEATCSHPDEIEHGRPLSKDHLTMLAESRQFIAENGGEW